MSRIDASLWDVLNVKALGHRRGLGRRWGQWSWRRLGGWRGPSFFVCVEVVFADLTKVSGFLKHVFFSLGCFCEM